jgi:hypothetical protein
MRAAPVLKEVNGLPGAEGKPSFDQGNRKLDLGECRAKIRHPLHWVLSQHPDRDWFHQWRQ